MLYACIIYGIGPYFMHILSLVWFEIVLKETQLKVSEYSVVGFSKQEKKDT